MWSRTIGVLGAVTISFGAGAQPPDLPGRYFTPASFIELINDPKRESMAQVYLMGTYDLTQDSHQSCAIRGKTTPQLLEQVFIDYVKAHPEVITADRTAGGVAAEAFKAYWPCK